MVIKLIGLGNGDPYCVKMWQALEAADLINESMYLSDYLALIYPNEEVLRALGWISQGGDDLDEPRSTKLAFRQTFKAFPHMGIETVDDVDLFLSEVRKDLQLWKFRIMEFERTIINSFCVIQAKHNVL